MMLSRIRLIAFGLLAVIVTASCAGTPSTSGEYPPPLPPVQSVQMEVADLPKDVAYSKADTQVTVENYNRASDLTFSLAEDISSHLVVPETLFTAAFNAQPQFNENNQWEWNYEKVVGGQEFPIRLLASRVEENKVEWDFYIINSQLGMEDQLLISGRANTDGTNGSWTFYLRNGNDREESAQLEWSVNEAGDIQKRLEFKSNRNGNKGNYIEYTFDGVRKTMIYYDASADQSIEVQRNLESNIGYVFSPDYNQGQQACWDKNYEDVLCSDV